MPFRARISSPRTLSWASGVAVALLVAGVTTASCSERYTALPAVDAGAVPDGTVTEEPLDCITFSVFDLADTRYCRTSGSIDDDCSGANGHSKVTVDRVAKTVVGTAINDPKVEVGGIPAVKGEAYAVFDLPQSPKKVTLNHTFRVDSRSASKMAYTPGCSLEWTAGEVQDNLDLDIGRDGLTGVYYYRGSIPNDGTFLVGEPFPTRVATFGGLLEAYASAKGSQVSAKVTEGQTVYLDVSKNGQPDSREGILRDYDPVTFTIYCGMSVQDGDAVLMSATGTSFDPKITACYPKGTAPPPPVYVPPADAGADTGIADSGPKDASTD